MFINNVNLKYLIHHTKTKNYLKSILRNSETDGLSLVSGFQIEKKTKKDISFAIEKSGQKCRKKFVCEYVVSKIIRIYSK